MRYVLHTLLVPCLLLSPALPAQAGDLPARGPIPFATYDQNHDGSISPDEFNLIQQQRQDERMAAGMPDRRMMNAPSFEDFDTNADDRISPEELRAGQKAMREQRMQQRRQMRPGAGQRQGMGQGQSKGMKPRQGMRQGAMFKSYDRNHDGVIDEQEFAQRHAQRMQRRSEEGRMMKRAANAPSFEEMDSNHDKRITPAEFRAWHRQHRPMGAGN